MWSWTADSVEGVGGFEKVQMLQANAFERFMRTATANKLLVYFCCLKTICLCYLKFCWCIVWCIFNLQGTKEQWGMWTHPSWAQPRDTTFFFQDISHNHRVTALTSAEFLIVLMIFFCILRGEASNKCLPTLSQLGANLSQLGANLELLLFYTLVKSFLHYQLQGWMSTCVSEVPRWNSSNSKGLGQ